MQRVTEPRPIEPILVHPVSVAAEEVGVEDVTGSLMRVLPRADLAQPIKDDVEGALAYAIDVLNVLSVIPGQFEFVVHSRVDVDGVHNRVVLLVVKETKDVTDLVDGDLEEVDAGTGWIGALVVLVLVEVDVSALPRMRQLTTDPIKRFVAVHVSL